MQVPISFLIVSFINEKSAFYWTQKDVANWIEKLGYPQYKPCLTLNNIDGRKLVLVEASTLPKIGIHDFDHIKRICAEVRELTRLPMPDCQLSISRENLSSENKLWYQKSRTGPNQA